MVGGRHNRLFFMKRRQEFLTILPLIRREGGYYGYDPSVTCSVGLPIASHSPIGKKLSQNDVVDDRIMKKINVVVARVNYEILLNLKEVGLSQLSEQLIAVVQETMQPAYVLLWIRKAEQERKPSI